jgi:hypothetical protein
VAWNARTQSVLWRRMLPAAKHHRASSLQRFGEWLWYAGEGGLWLIDPLSGERRDLIKLPRIDKVFSPLDYHGDWLLGFTNWTSCGVVRFSPRDRRVVWKYRRTFQGPSNYCRIWQCEDVIIMPKGYTELIGIDASTGRERWRHRTTPYLYSAVELRNGMLIFGTAGADGSLQVLDTQSGELRWSRFLKNGCQYFAWHKESIIAGDFDKCLRRFDFGTGEEQDQIELDAQVVGDVKVHDGRAFTTIWMTDQRPARLVCVDL